MKPLLVKSKKLKVKSSVSGFSLVEMLFYIAILSFSLLAVTETLITVTRSYGVLRAALHIEQEAAFALERMAREIRDANDINDAESVFNAHPGELFLVTTNAAGAARTVRFYLDNGKLSLKENGVATGAQTSAKTSVSNLVFRKITTARAKGGKVELTMQAGAGQTARSERFYATAMLRDSY
ncbi:MAG: prepilin-type N-terminal cleavage/methylation domain-containing protein [Patescibacteria group bacterium]